IEWTPEYFRGGAYDQLQGGNSLRSDTLIPTAPSGFTAEDGRLGFRLSYIPEPSSLVLGVLGVLGALFLGHWRRLWVRTTNRWEGPLGEDDARFWTLPYETRCTQPDGATRLVYSIVARMLKGREIALAFAFRNVENTSAGTIRLRRHTAMRV